MAAKFKDMFNFKNIFQAEIKKGGLLVQFPHL